jgi:hypothetical protein
MAGEIPILATEHYQRRFLVLRGLFYIFRSRGGQWSNLIIQEYTDKIDP